MKRLQKNKKGRIIGFELEPSKHSPKRETLKVIAANTDQFKLDTYYTLVIGDATETVNIEKYGEPDMVLIDSCHDAWFADWYIEKLLPNVKFVSFIQDISYSDRLEPSTESEALRKHISDKNPIYFK